MADESTSDDKRSSGDLRGLLRQLVTPVIEQVETRVSTQIDAEVAERIDELLNTRMATIDRAIGGIDHALHHIGCGANVIDRHGVIGGLRFQTGARRQATAIGGIDRHLSELSARLDRLERHLGAALEAPAEAEVTAEATTDDEDEPEG